MNPLQIGYDRELSTEVEPMYFVYDTSCENAIIYKGRYVQCLCIIGNSLMEQPLTMDELRDKTNGFV